MKFSRILIAGTFSLLMTALPFASVSHAGDALADDVMGALYTMKSVYRAEYAPAEWKKRFANYDLDTEFNKAVAAVQAKPNLTLADAREIFKNFVYAMRDYHTSISFVSTEAANLGLSIKSAGDKVFLVYIDRAKFSEASFPFHVGDELVTVDGKPATQAIAEVQAQITENVPGTDKAIAELRFFSRAAARGYKVPRGPITLGIKPKDSSHVTQFQLLWDYTPEKVSPRGTLTSSTLPLLGLNADNFLDSLLSDTSSAATSALFHPRMNVKLADTAPADNPYNLGTRSSFMPDLGTKVWESGDDNFFHAYVYKSAGGKLIGYVRIASYEAPDYPKALADFGKIVTLFQATTDSMVIDEVNNPGGSVLYLYGLASMLSDQPLVTPRHRMSITQADISQALDMIKKLSAVQSDDDAKKAISAGDLDGYTPSYEFARFQLNYAQFLVEEWNAGRKLTNPYWIGGVDHINAAANHYSKPILLLINHLDFSGGDFFPTIMQDNHRVTILGSRTAGAGGYVNDVQVPNNVGIDAFRCTESIAERVDGNPIENLGVKPDIEYEMTEADYTQGYTPYINAVQAAASALAK